MTQIKIKLNKKYLNKFILKPKEMNEKITLVFIEKESLILIMNKLKEIIPK